MRISPRLSAASSARRVVPAVLAGALVTSAALTVTAPAAGADTLVVHKTKMVVTLHGEGHGHGMSQYGAKGAALAGRSYRQIVAFYYPHTTLSYVRGTAIRVRLSGAGSTTTVGTASALSVSGVAGTLPIAGIARYRLLAGGGHSETLQRLAARSGARWTTVRSGLPNGTTFWRRNGGAVRLMRTDGRSTTYYGTLRAIRKSGSGSASGVYTVNRVSLESYTAGVAPREMPASWPRQAVAAQAVAARTYGLYGVRHPRSANYDICDTTSCQVYGGHVHFGPKGKLLWGDDSQAARDSAGRVLTYKGSVAFAQFSASNGGWTVSGGKPYLVTERDPYDSKRSGDPFLSYNRTVGVSSVARYYGLSTVTKIVVTKRDGHGVGGGRILSAYVYGLHGKTAKRVSTTGDNLNWALGAGTTWFTLRNA
ncbi:SpoIID/LytB domain-containing protein [uncultured Jatrophihabitans sp.]|uniref:SpoIID/LytB domain-containing protein n=1 Tax=uncultured Jatrophihabitans sp. TaxID=1610747 RepID=UPI0035C9EA8A